MGYEKIKSISRDSDGRVFITSASSNVFPINYSRYHCKYFDNMTEEQFEEYILEQYQGGMMQLGNNDYNNCGKLFGCHNMENLRKLRQLKKANRGRKFIVRYGAASFIRSRGKAVFDRNQAKKYDYVQAHLTAKLYKECTVECF